MAEQGWRVVRVWLPDSTRARFAQVNSLCRYNGHGWIPVGVHLYEQSRQKNRKIFPGTPRLVLRPVCAAVVLTNFAGCVARLGCQH